MRFIVWGLASLTGALTGFAFMPFLTYPAGFLFIAVTAGIGTLSGGVSYERFRGRRNPDFVLPLALCLGIAGSTGLAINLVLQVAGAPLPAIFAFGFALGMFALFFIRGI